MTCDDLARTYILNCRDLVARWQASGLRYSLARHQVKQNKNFDIIWIEIADRERPDTTTRRNMSSPQLVACSTRVPPCDWLAAGARSRVNAP